MSKLYFVATKHEQYRTKHYEPDSVIVDPWRYVPDQLNSRVRRIGQRRPETISVLIPSRGRPEMFERMYRSLVQTVVFPRQVEVVAMLDEDDLSKANYPIPDGIMLPTHTSVKLIYAVGDRCLLSEAWNNCVYWASGNIFMHCGDDLTFDTPGWDVKVRDAFAAVPDKILFAYGNDLGPHGETFGTHGFIHRRWIEATGYFLPPLFSSDWNDVWLNEVARMINRHQLLDFVTEHHHYTFGKAERDQTHAEREERGIADGVVDLYKRTAKEREADAMKLREVMA